MPEMDEEFRKEFRGLAQEWTKATVVLSDPNEILAHPARLRLVELGKADPEKGIRLAFAELVMKQRDWFQTLSEIAGEDPASSAISFDDGIEAWIAWANARNNPENKPTGHYTGRCSRCGSDDLWDDATAYGCEFCGAMWMTADMPVAVIDNTTGQHVGWA
jgi:hypothetical protein